MPEIRPLTHVKLREAWPDEARHFTPWLANNIDLLGAKLDLTLEQVQVEVTLPSAGRVDICARQAGTGANVVIENQLGESDDSHCLRLLGYAANAEANILVWVAGTFTSYHKSILKWLNDADTIHVYAVTVRAYRVGEALAVDFQTVVEPQSQPRSSRPDKKNSNTLFGEFYRPLVARLRQKGMQPLGRGGWRGRWRSFQSGHAGAIYGTGLVSGKARVFLSLNGTGHQRRYRALFEHQQEVAGEVDGNILWQEGSEGDWESLVMLERDVAVSLTESEEEQETARQWMAHNLIPLRDALQPHLDQLMRAEDAAPDAGS